MNPLKLEKNQEKADLSLYLEEFQNDFLKTKTINPKFYSVNLIDLVRKQENKTAKKSVDNQNFLENYNAFGQKNLLEEEEEYKQSKPRAITKPITKPNEKKENKSIHEITNFNIETKQIIKNKDSEGNKTINQYSIIKTLGR